MRSWSKSELLLSKKRTRKRMRRSVRKAARHFRVLLRKRLFQERFGDRSQIIRKLAHAYKPDIPLKKSQLTVTLPKVFSVIENPVQTVSAVLAFAKTVRQSNVWNVCFDQSRIEVFDLAAMALLDTVAAELATEAKHRGKRIKFSGRYPVDAAVRRFVRSMGLVKHLHVKKEVASGHELANLRLFDRRNAHYRSALDPRKADFKAKTIVGFVDHINNCLGDHRRTLTIESRAKLCDYIGEILGNAEDHPGFVDWTVQGYLDNELDVPICEIAIFNFGKSIAETLKELPSSSYTRRQIDPYLLLHNGRGFFTPAWRPSDLLTLIALQGHVSSKNNTEDDTRGQGMGDLIDFFQKVHQECGKGSHVKAKMALVSGGTHILFDGTYQMKEKGSRGRVIAFNRANELHDKPDSQYVKSMGNLHFPGTIISIRFPLSVDSTLTIGGHEK